MNSEIIKMYQMKYDELVSYLKNKYGNVPKNYFANENMRSKSSGITRTSDGLFIHHIKEDRAILLGNPAYAQRFPFEYQLKENLVYCNYIEHLILHMLIVKKVKGLPIITEQGICQVGSGGIFNFILPELVRFFTIGENGLPWQKNCQRAVQNYKEEFIEIVTDFLFWIAEDCPQLLDIYREEIVNSCMPIEELKFTLITIL